MKNKYIYLSILVVAGLVSCEPEFENPVEANYSAGDANFSSYVAIGNSLTAGYMDGTVYRSGQANSFPNLLSQQFAQVGGGIFTQPSYADDVNDLGGLQGLTGTRLIINAAVEAPQPQAGSSTIKLTPQAKAFNNMGVPGAKSFHLLAPGYGNIIGLFTGQANPYFVRHATSLSATVLGDAMMKNPTFFTNWIGVNDVLAYATSGGSGVDQTGNMNPATYDANDITNPTVFAGVYTQIINTLTSNGAKGVVATIPSVTSIPYFTTVPYNPISAELINANPKAALLVQLYQFLAGATNGRVSVLNTTAGQKNPILIEDDSLSSLSAQITAYANGSGNPLFMTYANQLGAIYGKARQSTSSDLVVLTASSVIGSTNSSSTGLDDINGLTHPMANKWVLTSTESAKVATATMAYNAAIKSIAASKNLAVADMDAIMGQLVSGLKADNGTIYTANYFSGGSSEFKVLFSLDGVHPNARGYSVITNEILKTIEMHYNAKLPLLNSNNFPGITILPTN